MICTHRTRAIRAGFLALVLFAAAWSLASCTGPDGDPTADQNVEEIYRPVIADLVARSPKPELEGDAQLLVFVETIGPAITLETQVALIESFAESVDLRFIDARSEAVDLDSTSEPVRAGSVLIGIALIRSGATAAEVRGETYRSADDVSGYHYTLKPHTELGWDITGEPESVEPEWLVVSP